ncbi:hypothetical protein Tco_1524036 [Tanacetum coccineum]
MHNNIMAAGSKYRPPMLGPGRYSQWRSRFLRYIDTKPNGEGLRKSILSGPYVPSIVLVQAVAATEGKTRVCFLCEVSQKPILAIKIFLFTKPIDLNPSILVFNLERMGFKGIAKVSLGPCEVGLRDGNGFVLGLQGVQG